tara:strand:+ start:574 stop:2091 length:1518 start_codon:yes stop_codon:yes gene_type:complete
MAKSIYGAADSTLVNMAYRASMANVPLNNAAIFAQREQNLKDFTVAVGNFMDNQWQDHKATEKERLELAQAGEEILLSGGNVNDFYLNIHNDTVLDYKRRNDAIKQDRSLDRESRERVRQGLEIEMGKYKNSLDQEQEVMTFLLNNSANDRIYTDINSPEAKAFNSVLKDLVDGTNNSKRTIENGEIMYTINGEKISLRDIKKGFSAHDPEFKLQKQKEINQMVNQLVQVKKLGAEIKQDDLARMKNTLFTGVTSMDQIRNLAHSTFGKQNHSFEEVLHAQAKASGPGGHEMINNTAIETIYNELDRLGGIDMDGDGDVDQKDKDDYRNAENAGKLIENIKKDKFLYRDLVVGYIMEDAVKDVYSVGMMQRVDAHRLKAEESAARKTKAGKESAYMIPGVGQVSAGTFKKQYKPYIDFLNNPKEGQEMQSPSKGLRVQYKNGAFYVGDKKVGNAKDAAEYDGLMNYITNKPTTPANINFVDFNNDRDGDGVPNNIDREPDNPNNK